jgi:hypothetical protein
MTYMLTLVNACREFNGNLTNIKFVLYFINCDFQGAVQHSFKSVTDKQIQLRVGSVLAQSCDWNHDRKCRQTNQRMANAEIDLEINVQADHDNIEQAVEDDE